MRIKKPKIDWIQFDSWLEWEIYNHFKKWTIWDIVPELDWYKIISTSPPSFEILPGFTAWEKKFRALIYTPDFIIKKWRWPEIILEVKSAWSARKPDYRLRIKFFLYKYFNNIKFMELNQVSKKKYILTKYF